jgi:magnesium transporter
MLKRFEITNGCIVSAEKDTAPILVVTNPDNGEKDLLLRDFKIDEHTLQSALDPDEISRLEFEEDHYVLIFKRPKNYSSEEQFLFKVLSIGVFIFKDRLIVVSSDDIPFFDGKHFAKVQSLNDTILKLIYRAIYHYLEHLKVINMISSEIEQKVNTSMENKYLLHMFTLEKSLVYYLNSINSNGTVITKLKNNAVKLGFSPDDMALLDDIFIENDQCYRQAEIYSNILSSLMDARASIVNNNLNLLIKRLTVLSVVFMPLNIIAGIGGMSEFSMMTAGIPWQISYLLFTVGIIIVGFLTYWILQLTGLDSNVSGRKRRSLG